LTVERAQKVAERLRQLFRAHDPRAPRLLGAWWERADTGRLQHIVRRLPRPARAVMDAVMWQTYVELPEEFVCFRGADEHSREGCSWTRQVVHALFANFWINRRGRRIVLVGRVLKRAVRFAVAGPAGEIVVPTEDVSIVDEQMVPDEVVNAVEFARQAWADGRHGEAEAAYEQAAGPFGETIIRLLSRARI
jgi:hypothetical protein